VKIERKELEKERSMNEEKSDTSPMVKARRINRHIRIEERNDPPSALFDVSTVYPSDALPEWFAGLQAIVEDETFTNLEIHLGKSVSYHISLAGEAPPATLARRWKEPKTDTVHLANGDSIQTEINGKTLDGSSGYILLGGNDVTVDLIDGRWQERVLCSQCHRPIDRLHTHTENGVKQNYCSYCYRSQCGLTCVPQPMNQTPEKEWQ
jgi:hypothetical protein